MGNLYIGLVHYPCRNRKGEIVTTALTGLDIPDIARSAKTYDVTRYYVITPLESQRQIATRLVDYWISSDLVKQSTHRGEALQLVRIVATLEDSLKQILSEEGLKPLLIGTSAREWPKAQISYKKLRELLEADQMPIYILFGTGWGLADSLIDQLDYLLPPIWGPGEYNHLSVRAAAAIILDRLRGRS